MSHCSRSLPAALALASLLALGPGGAASGAGAQRATPSAATYTNPVIPEDFPDPFILRVGQTYYAYATNSGGNNVPVQRSGDLVHWQFVGDALTELPSWASGGYTWAPEVMAVKGGYDLYYVARDTASGRQCIGVATAAKPTGPFHDIAKAPLVCQLDLGGSIDPSPFVAEGGQRYLYWKNDGNCCGKFTSIWVQRLSPDGLKLLGTPHDVLRNDQLWEGNLIEAPNVYRHGGKYYLFYSAADYASDTYGVGYAVGTSPSGPFRKVTRDGPWLGTKGQVAGPGGEDVFTDAQGHTWLAYHAWTQGQVGYNVGGVRSLRLDRLTWKGGVPVLAGPSVTPEPAPLGR